VKLLLAGDFSPDLDEGFKNITHYLTEVLEEHHSVSRFDVKRAYSARQWVSAATARAQVIHLVAAPTLYALWLGILLRLLNPGARLVVSALRPQELLGPVLSRSWKATLRLARPDLVLVQDRHTSGVLVGRGIRAEYLPNGVDLDRFHPVTEARKHELRAKYGWDRDRPLVLHVGHLQRARNLIVLAPLVNSGATVVVAGSLYMGTDLKLVEELRAAGLTVLEGFQADVHELYMAADCYAFPTQPGDSLAMPLSILEAMAVNLPVVTTGFTGIRELFTEGAGLRFSSDASTVPALVLEVLRGTEMPRTRGLVQGLGWDAIGRRLDRLYESLPS